METKNGILARQKEMQLSLDKVKHLVRLIQAFNFNPAASDPNGRDVRVQDAAAPPPEAKPASPHVEPTPPEADAGDAAESDKAGERAAERIDTTCGDADCRDGVTPGPDDRGGAQTEPAVRAEGTAEGETDASPQVDAATSSESPTPATNGTGELPPPRPPPSAADNPPAAAADDSENKMSITGPSETATRDKRDINDSNSKTSEPSQHCVPAE